MTQSMSAVKVDAGKDRFNKQVSFVNGHFDCKASAKDTGGALCVYDTTRFEKGGPPLHYHRDQDEWFFVREGEFIFEVGGGTFHLDAGDSLLAPRNVPHAFANLSETGKLLIIYQPAGTIEQFFRDGSTIKNATPEALQALYRAHGMEIVGPPLKMD